MNSKPKSLVAVALKIVLSIRTPAGETVGPSPWGPTDAIGRLDSKRVREFAIAAASLKLRGASGSPMRPIALPAHR